MDGRIGRTAAQNAIARKVTTHSFSNSHSPLHWTLSFQSSKAQSPKSIQFSDFLIFIPVIRSPPLLVLICNFYWPFSLYISHSTKNYSIHTIGSIGWELGSGREEIEFKIMWRGRGRDWRWLAGINIKSQMNRGNRLVGIGLGESWRNEWDRMRRLAATPFWPVGRPTERIEEKEDN